MLQTFASIFTGLGGVDIGASNAGLKTTWGIEIDKNLAEISNYNLKINFPYYDIYDVNPKKLDRVDILHASPPCKSYVARSSSTENDNDINLAEKVADIVNIIRPEIFTLENVYAYQKSKAWQILKSKLEKNYLVFEHKLNAMNFEVPQSRKRFIIIAIKNKNININVTISDNMNGWYNAVQDLIPLLEDDELANWQKGKVDINDAPIIIDGGNATNKIKATYRKKHEPCFTILASGHTRTRIISEDHKVLKANCRTLARLQTFPDWYLFPENKISNIGIGNAVPPLMYSNIIKQIMEIYSCEF